MFPLRTAIWDVDPFKDVETIILSFLNSSNTSTQF